MGYIHLSLYLWNDLRNNEKTIAKINVNRDNQENFQVQQKVSIKRYIRLKNVTEFNESTTLDTVHLNEKTRFTEDQAKNRIDNIKEPLWKNYGF